MQIGPATVRMVSNSGPPVPMPMQVPPGHMVQQIVDENGILTHVILSPQPPGIPASGMMVRYCTPSLVIIFHLASAVAAVDSSQWIASSPASCRECSPPPNFVDGHSLTI